MLFDDVPMMSVAARQIYVFGHEPEIVAAKPSPTSEFQSQQQPQHQQQPQLQLQARVRSRSRSRQQSKARGRVKSRPNRRPRRGTKGRGRGRGRGRPRGSCRKNLEPNRNEDKQESAHEKRAHDIPQAMNDINESEQQHQQENHNHESEASLNRTTFVHNLEHPELFLSPDDESHLVSVHPGSESRSECGSGSVSGSTSGSGSDLDMEPDVLAEKKTQGRNEIAGIAQLLRYMADACFTPEKLTQNLCEAIRLRDICSGATYRAFLLPDADQSFADHCFAEHTDLSVSMQAHLLLQCQILEQVHWPAFNPQLCDPLSLSLSTSFMAIRVPCDKVMYLFVARLKFQKLSIHSTYIRFDYQMGPITFRVQQHQVSGDVMMSILFAGGYLHCSELYRIHHPTEPNDGIA